MSAQHARFVRAWAGRVRGRWTGQVLKAGRDWFTVSRWRPQLVAKVRKAPHRLCGRLPRSPANAHTPATCAADCHVLGTSATRLHYHEVNACFNRPSGVLDPTTYAAHKLTKPRQAWAPQKSDTCIPYGRFESQRTHHPALVELVNHLALRVAASRYEGLSASCVTHGGHGNTFCH